VYPLLTLNECGNKHQLTASIAPSRPGSFLYRMRFLTQSSGKTSQKLNVISIFGLNDQDLPL
jgi:hypothetical protein